MLDRTKVVLHQGPSVRGGPFCSLPVFQHPFSFSNDFSLQHTFDHCRPSHMTVTLSTCAANSNNVTCNPMKGPGTLSSCTGCMTHCRQRHIDLLSLHLKASAMDLVAFFMGEQYPSPSPKTATSSTCTANSKHRCTRPHTRPQHMKFTHTIRDASLTSVTLYSSSLWAFVSCRKAMFIYRNHMTRITFSFHRVDQFCNKLDHMLKLEGECYDYIFCYYDQIYQIDPM